MVTDVSVLSGMMLTVDALVAVIDVEVNARECQYARGRCDLSSGFTCQRARGCPARDWRCCRDESRGTAQVARRLSYDKIDRS